MTHLLYTILPKWLGHESVEDELSPYAFVPHIPMQTWHDAQQLAQSDAVKLTYEYGNLHIIPSTALWSSLSEGDVKAKRAELHPNVVQFKKLLRDPTNHQLLLKDFLEVTKSCYVMYELDDRVKSVYDVYACSCPAYMHKCVCKHSLAFAIAKKKLVVPPEAVTQTIETTVGPGRPRKATRALDRM